MPLLQRQKRLMLIVGRYSMHPLQARQLSKSWIFISVLPNHHRCPTSHFHHPQSLARLLSLKIVMISLTHNHQKLKEHARFAICVPVSIQDSSIMTTRGGGKSGNYLRPTD